MTFGGWRRCISNRKQHHSPTSTTAPVPLQVHYGSAYQPQRPAYIATSAPGLNPVGAGHPSGRYLSAPINRMPDSMETCHQHHLCAASSVIRKDTLNVIVLIALKATTEAMHRNHENMHNRLWIYVE